MRHGLARWVLLGFVGGLRLLPFDLACALGAGLGRVIGLLARRDTGRIRRALAHLDEPPSVGACWADLGRRFVEFALAERALKRVEADLQAFEAALEQKCGVLVCTCHLGNWELLGACFAAHGYDTHSLSARDQGGPLYRWLREHRASLGVFTHPPGGGARSFFERSEAGMATGILVDQRTEEPSQMVSFLGETAPTPTTAEYLVGRSGAVPVFAWIVREGRRFRVQTALESSTPGLTERLTVRVEALVEAHPSQWIWLHDRWGP